MLSPLALLSGNPLFLLRLLNFLRANEVFEVRLDKMVAKWAGSIEIGESLWFSSALQLH